MDDRRIEVFLSTVRHGSFSRAAEQLHCSQSAVTQIMSSLETELGCKLLKRQHNGITLTSQGEALLPAILEADQALRKLRAEAAELSEAKQPPIRIGTYSSVANTFLPALIRKYQQKHPKAAFVVRTGCDNLNQWLFEDEVDLILADETHSKGLRWYPLLEDPYYAVIPADLLQDPDQTEITRDDFFKLPFIMASNNNYRDCMDALPRHSLNVVCDDDSTLVNMVSQGLGTALLPQLSIINPPANVRTLPILPESYRVIGVATPSKLSARTGKFLEFILDEMQN